jgi:uncharacterized protein YjdB
VQLSAIAEDSTGAPLADRPLTWATSDSTIATVGSTGLVTGVAAGGPVTITATSEGRSGSANVTVTPVPVATVALSPRRRATRITDCVHDATLSDARGDPLLGRTVTWSSSNAAVATVDGTGLVTGVGAGGPVTVTAASEGRSGTASITVTPAPVASVSVSRATATIIAGFTEPLTATAKDAHGNALPGRAVVWSSSDPAIATVSAAEVVTRIASEVQSHDHRHERRPEW